MAGSSGNLLEGEGRILQQLQRVEMADGCEVLRRSDSEPLEKHAVQCDAGHIQRGRQFGDLRLGPCRPALLNVSVHSSGMKEASRSCHSSKE
jgi:hypothetical protein